MVKDRGPNIPPAGLILDGDPKYAFIALCFRDLSRTGFNSFSKTNNNQHKKRFKPDQYVSAYPLIRLAPTELVEW